MAPTGKKPCTYVDKECTRTTPNHASKTTRKGASKTKTEAYARTHASECPNNPMMGEDRQGARDREETNEQRRAEDEPRRENAQQEGADTVEPIRRNHRGQETSKGDLPEKSCQGQRANN